MKTQAEWQLEGLPPLIDGATFEVWITDGSTRRVARDPGLDWSSLFFQDCTHPAQNAYCSPDIIAGWRLT